MSHTYHPRMVEIHETSTLYPDCLPFTWEWWMSMSSFAYLCWGWGILPHARWVKLDHFIFSRAHRACDEGRFTHE